jgi:hypothetical protein
MPAANRIVRPGFDEALQTWRKFLEARSLPGECRWIFGENLCFENDGKNPAESRVSFQTRFTPPPEDAERVAYNYYREFATPLVFYRAGTCGGKSICLLLCDPWFEQRGPAQGYERRDPWAILFRAGGPEAIEEVQDENRWRNRVFHDKPLHDLDFSMTLRAVHEILAHGRVLSTYEHYALKFLHLWRRMLD